MQITLSKTNYWKYAVLVLFVALGIGAYSYLSNKICLFCPVEIPLDYETTDHVHTKVNSEGVILLFRGVHAQHPDLPNAKMGVATPIGGHENPEWHNLGNNRSVFTSWTSSIWLANFFANKTGKGGIILVKHFHESQLVTSPDKHRQNEFLIKGVVIGAIPISAFEATKP